MKRSPWLLLALAGGVVALDLWTKRWAHETLRGRDPVEIVGQFVRFTYTRNSGVAFGLGAGVRFPYYVFSILAVGVILYLFLRRRVLGLPRQVALALILGGAVGNLVDRLKSGQVVDFIEIGWNRWHWPVFNVADSAVTVGVALFAFAWSSHAEGDTPGQEPALLATPGDAPGNAPAPASTDFNEADARSLGAGAEGRGTAGPVPGGGAGRPLA